MPESKEDALNAYKAVQKALQELKNEYAATGETIAERQAQMSALKKMHVPFEDLKQGMLEMVDTAGSQYIKENTRPALIGFATGMQRGVSGDIEYHGRPLTLEELVGAVNRTAYPLANASLIQPSISGFNHIALYALFGEAIKEKLREVLESLTPEDFGYNKIHPDKIGPTRAAMHEQLAAWQQDIDTATARRSEVATQLRQLGFNMTNLR